MKKLIILTTFISLNAIHDDIFDTEYQHTQYPGPLLNIACQDYKNSYNKYECVHRMIQCYSSPVHDEYEYRPRMFQYYLFIPEIIPTKKIAKSLKEILIEKIASMDISKEELETLPRELQYLIIEERETNPKPV